MKTNRSPQRPTFVVGNWKMHGSLATNISLLHSLAAETKSLSTRCAVCVPFPYIAQARSLLAGSPVSWGAQDVSEFASGAYTGAVSASMLTDFDCMYVIVGHSERRSIFAENDDVVARKAKIAIQALLTPIVCLGESLREREEGKTAQVVIRQLDAVVTKLAPNELAKTVIAYEPVWAIGTGKTASPAQAQEVHALIRTRLKKISEPLAQGMLILYGGSVKPENALELFQQPDIDGGLIGGASLVAKDFLAICSARDRLL